MLPRQQEGTAESQAERRTQKWFIVIVLLLNITQVSSILREYLESVIILSRNTHLTMPLPRVSLAAPPTQYIVTSHCSVNGGQYISSPSPCSIALPSWRFPLPSLCPARRQFSPPRPLVSRPVSSRLVLRPPSP